jgi:hypothetical protein
MSGEVGEGGIRKGRSLTGGILRRLGDGFWELWDLQRGR